MITSLHTERGAFVILSAAIGLVCLTGVEVQGESIDDAVAQVKRMVREGKSRAEIGRWVTRTLDKRIRNLNSPMEGFGVRTWLYYADHERLVREQEAFDRWRNQGVFTYETAAKWAWDKQVGQCEEQACSAYYILHKAGVPGRLQIIGSPSHAFVVWGMSEGADLNDLDTWGKEAVIVDGWLGDSTPQVGPGAGTAINDALTRAVVYRGEKSDFTPVFAGNLIIGGKWTLIADYRNAPVPKDRVKIESELAIKQFGDRFTGELSRGNQKAQLTDGWIKQGGLLSFKYAAGPLKGTGLFRLSDDGKSVKGRYTVKAVFEGVSIDMNVPFTGTVKDRTLTLIPEKPRPAGG